MSAPSLLRRRGRRALALAATVGVVATLGVVSTPTAQAVIGTAAGVADDGAKVVSETVVDAQTVDLTVQSPALGKTGMVRLWLPRDWSSQPTTKWPTLYLLHGANEVQDYKSWAYYTTAGAFMRNQDVLTVMPTDGADGFYSDPSGLLSNPWGAKWETFHTVELPQIMERGYRSSGVRAVAGLSIGGYGAMEYATKHPGLYKAAASYSGILNIVDPLAIPVVLDVRLTAGDVTYPWGDPIANLFNWLGHNPQTNIAKLKGTAIFVSSGDGSPGPLDDPNFSDITGSRIIEMMARSSANSFVSALKSNNIPATTDLYTGGYHYWQYWDREFKKSWPVLAGGLGVDPTTGNLKTAATTTSSTSGTSGKSGFLGGLFG